MTIFQLSNRVTQHTIVLLTQRLFVTLKSNQERCGVTYIKMIRTTRAEKSDDCHACKMSLSENLERALTESHIRTQNCNLVQAI